MYSTILVIEQEFLIRRLLMKVLLLAGYQAQGVANGAEALTLLQKQSVDLILADGRVCAGGTNVAYQEIRQVTTAPILVLASSNRSSDLQRCLAWGADDCIAKPFTLAEVQGRVRCLLNSQCVVNALEA